MGPLWLVGDAGGGSLDPICVKKDERVWRKSAKDIYRTVPIFESIAHRLLWRCTFCRRSPSSFGRY